jgi:hypothetical protein
MNPHQNETADRSIERSAVWNLENIGSDEFHITQASIRYAGPCAGD